MGKKRIIKDLETLDISVLLKTVYYEDSFNLVSMLLKYAFGEVSDRIMSEQSIPMDSHYTITDEYKKTWDNLQHFCSTLLGLQGALLQGVGLHLVIKDDEQIDFKVLLYLLPLNKEIELIDVCLRYVEKVIENQGKESVIWDKAVNKDEIEKYIQEIRKLKELKDTLIAIRKEDVIEEDKDLPF